MKLVMLMPTFMRTYLQRNTYAMLLAKPAQVMIVDVDQHCILSSVLSVLL